MVHHRYELGSLRGLLTALVVVSCAFDSGCGPGEHDHDHDHDDEGVECGGHGELHNGHCHCAAGYSSTEDGLSCFERDDADDGDDHSNNDHADHNNHDNHDHGGDGGDGGDGEFTFEPSSIRAAVGETQSGGKVWVVEGLDGGSLLQVELYPEYGGPSEAGHHILKAEDESYATCGTCVVLRTGCVMHAGHYDCEHLFMPAQGGVLHIDAIGAEEGTKLTARLEELQFREATIAQDLTTSLVDGGESHELHEWSFDVVLDGTGSGNEPECSGHGHMHGNACHCDPGYSVDPNDPTKCI